MDTQSDLYPQYVVNIEELMNDSEFKAEYGKWIDDVYEKDNRES